MPGRTRHARSSGRRVFLAPLDARSLWLEELGRPLAGVGASHRILPRRESGTQDRRIAWQRLHNHARTCVP